MKFKPGLTVAAPSVLFFVHWTTILRIFVQVLQGLTHNIAQLMFWPDQDIVRASTLACFYLKYCNTGVMTYCI